MGGDGGRATRLMGASSSSGNGSAEADNSSNSRSDDSSSSRSDDSSSSGVCCSAGTDESGTGDGGGE